MKKADIRNSLMEQLSSKRANVAHFEDKVNDYMELWDTRNKLQKAIDTHGAFYEEPSSGVMKKRANPAVKERVLVSKRMDDILDKMQLTTDTAYSDTGGDDDL